MDDSDKLTLRNRFAVAALTGLLMRNEIHSEESTAKLALGFADAVIDAIDAEKGKADV